MLIRLGLEVGLLQLNDREKFDELMFWGRIRGVSSDYYVAMGVKFTEYEFPSKSFYFATSNFHFHRLPAIQPLFKTKIEEVITSFIGNPEQALFEVLEVKIVPAQLRTSSENNIGDNQNPNALAESTYPQVNDASPVQNDLGNSNERLEELEKPTPEVEPEQREERMVTCKEIDRLAYVIRAIEFECACVPKGSLKMSLTHELRYNDGFRGIGVKSALQKESWLHFRQPLTQEKLKMMERPETVFSYDFLDDIAQDLPRNSWSLQSAITNEFVL
jgi:radial spoke head protein 9